MKKIKFKIKCKDSTPEITGYAFEVKGFEYLSPVLHRAFGSTHGWTVSDYLTGLQIETYDDMRMIDAMALFNAYCIVKGERMHFLYMEALKREGVI